VDFLNNPVYAGVIDSAILSPLSNLERGFNMTHLIEANGNKLTVDFSSVMEDFTLGSYNM